MGLRKKYFASFGILAGAFAFAGDLAFKDGNNYGGVVGLIGYCVMLVYMYKEWKYGVEEDGKNKSEGKRVKSD